MYVIGVLDKDLQGFEYHLLKLCNLFFLFLCR